MTFSCDSLRDPGHRDFCLRLEEGGYSDEDLKEDSATPWSSAALAGSDGFPLRNWIEGLRKQIGPDTAPSKSLFRALLAPEEQGGLNLAFDAEESGPARGALDVYRDRKANCVEFVSFFLMLAELLGIPAVPQELFQDAEGNFVEHVRVGLPDPDTGRLSNVADLADGRFGPPMPGEKGATLSRREFLADFYNLKAVRSGGTEAEPLIDFALRIDPRNYLALYNKAYYAAHRGKPTHALSYLLKSISAYPRYPLAYWNLMRIADQLNQTDIASWALERYRGLFPAL